MIFMNQRIEDFLTGCSREIKLFLSYLQIVINKIKIPEYKRFIEEMRFNTWDSIRFFQDLNRVNLALVSTNIIKITNEDLIGLMFNGES